MTTRLPTGPEKGHLYLGWSNKIAKPLRGFLPVVGLLLILGFGFAGYVIGATQNDPGAGGVFGGGIEAVGIVQANPYPLFHVTESDRLPVGSALIMAAFNKEGRQALVAPFDGQLVKTRGLVFQRGDLLLLMTNNMEAAEGAASAPEAVSLGRWKLTGEICDGKCYAGVMKPGNGLAHKACANLCLEGGVPPVFVSTGEVDGEVFFLMANAEGGPVTDEILSDTAVLVSVEGEIERRGGMMIFKIDPATLTVL